MPGASEWTWKLTATVEMDAGQTQEARTEFLTSAGNFLNNALPVMQSSPDLNAPHGGEMMLFAVRGYRAGRTLESAFEEAVQDIKERIEQQHASRATASGAGTAARPSSRGRGREDPAANAA